MNSEALCCLVKRTHIALPSTEESTFHKHGLISKMTHRLLEETNYTVRSGRKWEEDGRYGWEGSQS